MTFTEMLASLEQAGALKPTRVKDIRTALKRLALALGYPDADRAVVDDAYRDAAGWLKALSAHFATLKDAGLPVSASSQKATRNHLRHVFRAAVEQGLLRTPVPPRLLKKPRRKEFVAQQSRTTPYQETYRNQRDKPYSLPEAQWPQEITDAWRDYRARVVFTRSLRQTTLDNYAKCFRHYFGYVKNIAGKSPVWEDLFDVTRVVAFVQWHAARLGKEHNSRHGRMMVAIITAMARVLKHPSHEQLATYARTLRNPKATHIKSNHQVSLDVLDEVADAYIAEGREPLATPFNRPGVHIGSNRAGRFQAGLILKLITRVPIRPRNVREMQFHRNLAQDPTTGHWHLTFSGEELKISHRGQEVNVYTIDLTKHCPEWTALLEEWRDTHRPKLKNADVSQLVFLNQLGKPFTPSTLYASLAAFVSMRTGQRFYPHLIRTIFLTEYVDETHDFEAAATMLGDKTTTAMNAYYEVNVNKHQDRVTAWRRGRGRQHAS
jgi:hypothetical protein